MPFSDNLIRFRKEQKLSQEQLAEKLGVSRQAVSKWETDEAMPDLQKALFLAETLGVSLDSLCGNECLTERPSLSEPTPTTPGSRKRHTLLLSLAAIGFIALGLLLGALLVPLRGGNPASETEAATATAPLEDTAAEAPPISEVAYEFRQETVTVTFRADTQAAKTFLYTLKLHNGRGAETETAASVNAEYKDGVFFAELPISSSRKYSLSITVHTPTGETVYMLAKELYCAINGTARVITN